jgi:hypothetical protein
MFLACVLALLGCASDERGDADTDDGSDEELVDAEPVEGSADGEEDPDGDEEHPAWTFDEVTQWSCADLERHAAALIFRAQDCSGGKSCVAWGPGSGGACSPASGQAVTAEAEVHMNNVEILAVACGFELRLVEGAVDMYDGGLGNDGADCVRWGSDTSSPFRYSSDGRVGGELRGFEDVSALPEYICAPTWEFDVMTCG